MKRALLKKTLLILLSIFSIFSTFASSIKIGDFYYILYGDEAEVTCRDKYHNTNYVKGYIEIPSEISFEGKNYTVTMIGQSAFNSCIELTGITIPGTVKTIGQDAFLNCTSLKNVVMGNSIVEIGSGAFENCTNLDQIDLPESLQYIWNSSFSGCESLTNLIIPDSVTFIGWYAFGGCTKLTSIDIPASVTEFGAEVFTGCRNLESINVAPDNPNFASIDGVLFSKDFTILKEYPKAKKGPYIIPETVYGIVEGAFWGSEHLSEITIPNSVTYVGNRAFFYCNGLETINISTQNELVLDNEVFAYCDNIKSIYCRATVPPTSVNSNIFSETTYLDADLYVPQALMDVYQARNPWCNFRNIKVLEPDETLSVAPIGNFEFANKNVYNLSGVLILQDASNEEILNLPSGLYIFRGKKIRVK